MAYAAVISLKQTIQRLLNSSHISVVSSSQEILDSAYKQLISLQEVLTKSDDSNCSRKRLNHLEIQIINDLHKFEDSLEFHASDQFLSSSEEEVSSPKLLLELDFKEVCQEISSFIEAAKKMEKDYNQELQNPNYSDDDDDDLAAAFPSRGIDSAGVKMVGLSDIFTDLKHHLTRIIKPADDFGFLSFLGLGGMGRSVLAKSVYDDIEPSFDCRAWVRIGSKYNLKQILQNIIAQTNQPLHEFLFPELGEDELSEYLNLSLRGRRYIVGLDDIRDTDILIQLRRSLPEQNNGSAVFLTTSLMEVAAFDESFILHELPTLVDDHFSWGYIRSVFFAENEAIPPEFVEAGKKIACNCRGLRLVLARVIFVLWKHTRTIQFWRGLATASHDRIYQVEDEIEEISELEKYLGDGHQLWAKGLLDFSILRDRTKEHLYPDRIFPKMGIMTIYGMAGAGKTTLMKKLFHDQSVLHHFDHCVWVNAGSKYNPENILVDILAQTYPSIDMENINQDAELSTQLCKKKWLIVLDDLWSQEPIHCLKKQLPNIKGELMVTTRLFKVASLGPCDSGMKMRLLNKEESWDLLHEKVFRETPCSPQLVVDGMKIAENCEGLPLFILAVADHLSKSEITVEYWNEVAQNKFHSVMMDAHDEISKTLLPSYESLPQHLKACFLYMGVFPQGYEISMSKLKKMWFVEGFLEPDASQTVEDCASKYLKELVGENVVMVRQKGSYLKSYKSCGLHYVFWHLSCNEARKVNFFHALTTNVGDDSMESKKRQRRLCIRNSILLGFKDVYDNAMGSYSTSRALLCTGTPHQYSVPLYYGSRLLRVLDALAIRFYEFPIEVVKLIRLRYLALTCNESLPSSISNLWNRQFLIVKQHLSIKSSINDSYMPKEIWDMKELKHLQISGSKLPSPSCGDLLPNLSTLLEVSVHSCTKRVFKRIPNLKKLGIQIELVPNDKSNPFICLNHTSYLRKLESLKCVVVNPDLGLENVAPPTPHFPWSLKKLSLSGIGYPWEYMSVIGKLPNLEVLKLRCYAFRGPAWEIDNTSFDELKFLSIEDSDLVRWDIDVQKCSKLQFLCMKHCYKLKQLPCYLHAGLDKMEVIDGHPAAVSWAKEMKEKNWEKLKLKTLQIDVQSFMK